MSPEAPAPREPGIQMTSALLSLKTFQHSIFLHKTQYLVFNFKSNLGAYGHNLLAYGIWQGGANLHPGVNLQPRANLRPRANCAYATFNTI